MSKPNLELLNALIKEGANDEDLAKYFNVGVRAIRAYRDAYAFQQSRSADDQSQISHSMEAQEAPTRALQLPKTTLSF